MLRAGLIESGLEPTNVSGTIQVRQEVLGATSLLIIPESLVTSEEGRHAAFIVRHGPKVVV